MCTIGSVFVNNKQNLTFKQCDLEKETVFKIPEIESDNIEIKYLPFTRHGSNGVWAGVNNFGVSFVAADSYLSMPNKSEIMSEGSSGFIGKPKLTPVSEDIFQAYRKIISTYKNAKDAAEYMVNFYRGFGQPDILLISDAHSNYFIEVNKDNIECIELIDGHFVSTNHFRILYGAVIYQQNHSSYLRLQRAESILQNQANAQGIFDVVSDQYFGKTVLSVCREDQQTPEQEDPYFTQATAIFNCTDQGVNCAYQINGNPKNNSFTVMQDVFGQNIKHVDLSIKQAEELLTKMR